MESVTPAEVDGSTPSSPVVVDGVGSIELDKAEEHYLQLMGNYATALAQASRVGRGSDADLVDPKKSEYFSAGLLRLMVGSHVRNRLIELRAGFLQVAAAIAAGERRRAWLDASVEDVQQVIDSLPAIRVRPLLLVPIIAPAAALAGNIPGWVGYLFLGLSGALVTFVFLGYMAVRDSFRLKRRLLFPDAPRVDKLDLDAQKAELAGNTYAVENLAFGAIGRGKRLEVEVDRTLRHVTLLLVAEAALVLPIIIDEDAYLWITAVVLIVYFATLFAMGRWETKRFWR